VDDQTREQTVTLKPETTSDRRTPGQSVADWVADELKRHIASGELAPGDRLPGERQLSDALSVSRVSVRSALQNLKAQGLLSSVQGGGTHVVARDPSMDRPLLHLVGSDPSSLIDLAEMIGHVAAFGARRAAANVTREEIEDMKAVLETMALSGRSPSLQATDDIKFHALLARASQSGTYMHIMSVLQETLGAALMSSGTRNPPSREEAHVLLDLNRQLVIALVARNEDLCGELAQRHADQRRIMIANGAPFREAASNAMLGQHRQG
jgi:DNA-binding FadR family transcriptional regulator